MLWHIVMFTFSSIFGTMHQFSLFWFIWLLVFMSGWEGLITSQTGVVFITFILGKWRRIRYQSRLFHFKTSSQEVSGTCWKFWYFCIVIYHIWHIFNEWWYVLYLKALPMEIRSTQNKNLGEPHLVGPFLINMQSVEMFNKCFVKESGNHGKYPFDFYLVYFM